ncbi:glutathione S-transferase family protein [Sneathiella glossodoripedis]|uniref:glutathione S-transferase family protein n=1 Tax=Sneathiella glossodoripedis TaxID=418853 RepID=UPI00047008F1|nr:glutathione S-transferase family protein [Sneathiella glossodoripedis]
MPKHTIYHIPVCPFSQRLEILLRLKGQEDSVDFKVVDITRPRDPELLKKTRGTTALPVLETPDGDILKESLVILQYLEEILPGGLIRQSDPLKHAIENMLIAKEGPFTMAGYLFVMNQQTDRRTEHEEKLLGIYRDINEFLINFNPEGTYLFDEFGLAETVYTPMFMRFWFLDYYENFTLPDNEQYQRVKRWQDACLTHPAAQQVTKEEIVKLYYDYALGAGNGAVPEGRTRSSFVFEPHWKTRPWPPRNKYDAKTTDEELGLISA